MKLCIPTLDDKGRDARVHDHFGSAPWFTLVDTTDGSIETIANSNAHHAHGTCHPLSQLTGHAFDALVVGGIGRRALDSLKAAGLKVYRTPAPLVSGVIDAAAGGEMQELEEIHACSGHGHGNRTHGVGSTHGHGHGAGRGRGRGRGHGHGCHD